MRMPVPESSPRPALLSRLTRSRRPSRRLENASRMTQTLLTLTMAGALSMVVGCTGTPDPNISPTPTLPADGDVTGPEIVVAQLPDRAPLDEAIPVVATVTDDSGISSVALLYRAPGTDFWGSTFMSATGALNQWSASIPSTFVQPPGVEFYVRAVDASLNRNASVSPATAPTQPGFVGVTVPGQGFPFNASFDPPDGDPDGWGMADTGWKEYIEGFDDLLNWELSDMHPRSGGFSAFHGHGNPFQTGEFDDFLVSPPLDVSESASLDLYWYELADLGQYAEHSVLVSTGSPDPGDGDFVAIDEALAAPPEIEAGYGRSRHVDLSAYAGSPQLYVAFRYQGLWGDDWYIDDVVLEAPKADLITSAPTLSPDDVNPGDSATLALPVTNEGLVASGPLSLHVESTDAALQISPAELSFPALEPGESALLAGVTLTVPANHASHLYIPLSLTLSDGTRTWTQNGRLKVGQPATAHIQITHAFEDDLLVYLGYGDPNNPSYLTTVQADEGGANSGTFTWDVDISSQDAALPPDYDRRRWFVKVIDDSVVNTGTLDVFYIERGGEHFESEGLPQAIPDDQSAFYVWLPGMPRYGLRDQESEPSPAQPGDRVFVRLSLNSLSAPPSGTLIGTLSSSDPDVQSLDGGPVVFTYFAPGDLPPGGPWATPTPTAAPTPTTTPSATEGPTSSPGSTPSPTPSPTPGVTPTATPTMTPTVVPTASPTAVPTATPIPPEEYYGTLFAQEPFSFTVAGNHINSKPLRFTLTLSDDHDSMSLPVSVSVPFPVLGGLSLVIEDFASATAVNDALDPGEATNLRLRIRNGGDQATFGAVTVSLAVANDGGSGLVVPSDPIPLLNDVGQGVLEPGQGGKSALVPIRVTGGTAGTNLSLKVTVSDGTLSYTESRTLALGETPFNPILVASDPEGDANGSSLDIFSGTFRRQGTVLTCRWVSHSAFDITETSLYSYLSGIGGYQYAIYAAEPPLFLNWITTGDTGYWNRRYTPPASMVVDQLTSNTVEVRIDLAEIYLNATPLYGGASADNCGGAVGCDYAPDSANKSTGLTRFWW